MDNIQKNAEAEFESRVQRYKKTNGSDYRTAFYAVKAEQPELYRKYYLGADAPVKKYDADTLSAPKREMAILQADPAKVQTLAGWAIDRLAQRIIGNIGQGPYGAPTYKQAVVEVRVQNPALAQAADTGFIAADDWALLGLLIPSLQGEIQRGNFNRNDSNRCAHCGRNINLCRGVKLAAKRKVHADNVVAYSACIRDAQLHGTELDKIACLY
jgi:hypothetical protein